MNAPYNVDISLQMLIDIATRPIHTENDAMNLHKELKMFLIEQDRQSYERGYNDAIDFTFPS